MFKCEHECPGRTKDSVCGGRGKCDLAKGGQTKCLCSKGYGGRTCSESCPFKAIGKGEPVPCSGKGSCVPKGSAMQCMCKEGWLGKDCSIPCPTSASGEICGKRGMWLLSSTGKTAKCECKAGYIGLECAQVCPKSDAGAVCSGNGKCSLKDNTAECKCNVGFSGKDCETRICTTENSLFDAKTSRCLCEAGFTCCSQKKLMAMMESERSTEDQLEELEY